VLSRVSFRETRTISAVAAVALLQQRRVKSAFPHAAPLADLRAASAWGTNVLLGARGKRLLRALILLLESNEETYAAVSIRLDWRG
jgi:hypothetical protein